MRGPLLLLSREASGFISDDDLVSAAATALGQRLIVFPLGAAAPHLMPSFWPAWPVT